MDKSDQNDSDDCVSVISTYRALPPSRLKRECFSTSKRCRERQDTYHFEDLIQRLEYMRINLQQTETYANHQLTDNRSAFPQQPIQPPVQTRSLTSTANKAVAATRQQSSIQDAADAFPVKPAKQVERDGIKESRSGSSCPVHGRSHSGNGTYRINTAETRGGQVAHNTTLHQNPRPKKQCKRFR